MFHETLLFFSDVGTVHFLNALQVHQDRSVHRRHDIIVVGMCGLPGGI